MSGKANSEEVENFALKEIGAGPDRGDRFDYRVAAPQANFQADALFLRNREQMIDHFEARLGRSPVDAGNVGEEVESAFAMVAQNNARLPEVAAVDVDRHLVAVELDSLDGSGVPRG